MSSCLNSSPEKQYFPPWVIVYFCDSTFRFTRNFSKSAGRWTCVPVMEKNSYKYIPQLMKDIFRRRLDDDNSQLGRVVLAEDDPRHISGTIRPSQPPSVLQLLASHHSRMGPSSTVVMSQIYKSSLHQQVISFFGGWDGVVAQLLASHQSSMGPSSTL